MPNEDIDNRGFSVNARLTEEQFTQIDSAVIAGARRAIVGPKLLQTFPLGGIGVTSLSWDEVGGMTGALISMNLRQTNDDALNFTRRAVSVPITYKDFSIDMRELEASKGQGGGPNRPLDTANADEAGYQVALGVDDLIFKGVSAYGIEGIANVTGRQTQAAGALWEDPLADIYEDLRLAKKKLTAEGFRGPYVLVVADGLGAATDRVQDTSSARTWAELIEKRITTTVVESEALDAGTALLMQTGPQVADLPSATRAPRTMFKEDLGLVRFKTFEVRVPRIRKPKGIVEITGAA